MAGLERSQQLACLLQIVHDFVLTTNVITHNNHIHLMNFAQLRDLRLWNMRNMKLLILVDAFSLVYPLNRAVLL